MSTSLALTYDYLASTANTAACDVLLETLQSAGPRARRLSVESLAKRASHASFDRLLDIWQSLRSTEKRIVGNNAKFRGYLAESIADVKNSRWAAACEAIEQLSVYSALPELIRQAESSTDALAKKTALFTVLSMAKQLGDTARSDLDRPAVRRPVLDRLAVSVRSIEFHRCEELIDAFLSASTWTDSLLQAMLDIQGTSMAVLTGRMLCSRNRSVIDLLVGWISKNRIPDSILPILRSRDDPMFRNGLLRHVGPTPTWRTLRNLQGLQSMPAFEVADASCANVDSDLRPALLHVLHQLETQPQEVRELAVRLIESGDSIAVRAATTVLRRMGPLSKEILQPEAIQLARMLDNGAAYDPIHDTLLWRQIQLLDYPCAQVQSAVSLSLTNLTAKAFFDQKPPAGFTDISQVASVIHLVDRELDDYVIGALKHPLVAKRISAIDAVAALGLVDKFVVTLREVYLGDHLDVKIKIVQALHYSLGRTARSWLDELKAAGPGPIRDVARFGLDLLQGSPLR